MRIIRKPIIQQANGYWWAHSQVKPDRIYSLHTKDRDEAQDIYDRQIANARRVFDEADAGMDGVQERYRR
jgi:hypothetical protein